MKMSGIKWQPEADAEIRKAPFFVRKRARERVEAHVSADARNFVTLADCPNACSQPQIKDIGIIGAALPAHTEAPCSECSACVDVCREGAVVLDESEGGPVFDWEKCVRCGQCIKACPTGTIGVGELGYRLLIGGKLGRHPRLGAELPGLYDADTVRHLIRWCVQYYKQHSSGGERFAALVEKAGPEFFDLLAAEAFSFQK